jgi:hypothetical protein
LEGTFVVDEALPAKVFLAAAESLNHCAHRAVNDENALLQKLVKERFFFVHRSYFPVG